LPRRRLAHLPVGVNACEHSQRRSGRLLDDRDMAMVIHIALEFIASLDSRDSALIDR